MPECHSAESRDFAALGRMLEHYQYELSDVVDQDLDALGEYGYDLDRHVRADRFFAHVALVDGRYAGFALVAPALVTQTKGFWMEQFFILRKYRQRGHGRILATHVLDSHPGAWEIGQVPENAAARLFWRSVISHVTSGNYTELQVTQGWWQGTVQRFVHAPRTPNGRPGTA